MDQKERGLHLATVLNPLINSTKTMAKSFRYYLQRLEVNQTNEEGEKGDIYLSNHDLLPIPKENRIWGLWTYGLFWFGECASVTSWTVASTGVKAGLAWWESW